jgi:hypothetical protein
VRKFGGISDGKPSGIMIGCALGEDDARPIDGAGDVPLAGELPRYCDLTGEIPLAGELPRYCDLTGEIPLAGTELAVLLVGDGFPRVAVVLKG